MSRCRQIQEEKKVTPLEKRIKTIEGQAAIRTIDWTIKELKKKRKRIVDWLETHGEKGVNYQGNDLPVMPDGAYTKEFEELWKIYPERNGMKREKLSAFKRYKGMKTSERAKLPVAVLNYAKSAEAERYARDMIRFLKPDFWTLWINPTESMLQNMKEFNNHAPKKSVVDDILKHA
jgi:hypothetical protein